MISQLFICKHGYLFSCDFDIEVSLKLYKPTSTFSLPLEIPLLTLTSFINVTILCIQEACDGTTCEGESTCVVDGKDCKCIAGYYPEVTLNGMCTRK